MICRISPKSSHSMSHATQLSITTFPGPEYGYVDKRPMHAGQLNTRSSDARSSGPGVVGVVVAHARRWFTTRAKLARGRSTPRHLPQNDTGKSPSSTAWSIPAPQTGHRSASAACPTIRIPSASTGSGKWNVPQCRHRKYRPDSVSAIAAPQFSQFIRQSSSGAQRAERPRSLAVSWRENTPARNRMGSAGLASRSLIPSAS